MSLYKSGPPTLRETALETEPGSSERKRRLEKLVAEARNPDQARHVAELLFQKVEEWRPRLFPARTGSEGQNKTGAD